MSACEEPGENLVQNCVGSTRNRPHAKSFLLGISLHPFFLHISRQRRAKAKPEGRNRPSSIEIMDASSVPTPAPSSADTAEAGEPLPLPPPPPPPATDLKSYLLSLLDAAPAAKSGGTDAASAALAALCDPAVHFLSVSGPPRQVWQHSISSSSSHSSAPPSADECTLYLKVVAAYADILAALAEGASSMLAAEGGRAGGVGADGGDVGSGMGSVAEEADACWMKLASVVQVRADITRRELQSCHVTCQSRDRTIR